VPSRGPQRSRVLQSLSLLWVATLAAACGDTPPLAPSVGELRFVNLLADGTAQPIEVFLDGAPFGKSLPFGASSPLWLPPPLTANYARIPSGEHSIVVRRSRDSIVIALYDFDLAVGETRTLYATGGGGLFPMETVDDNAAPEPGTIRLRVVNLSFSAGTVDLFLTTQTADLATAVPVMTGTSVGGSSAYFSVSPGTYRVRAVRTGVAPSARSTNVVMNLNDQIWERGARTILIGDVTGGFGSFSAGVILSDQ
jgi:hypothetical protein